MFVPWCDHNSVYSPLRYILGSVALLGQLVVDEAELAALLAGRDAVQAHVELGAVVGVGVLGVGVELAELVSGGVGGALEPVGGLQSCQAQQCY